MMTLKHTLRPAMYGGFAGAAAGLLSINAGWTSPHLMICVLQFFATVACGAGLGLAFVQAPRWIARGMRNERASHWLKAISRHRWSCAIVALLALGGGAWFWCAVVVYWMEPHPGEFNAARKSSHLRRDIKLMWETKRLGGTYDPTHGPNPRSSTDGAINAASRVFNTVELLGKTRDEVAGLLGDPKSSSDSIYNFPFWPAPKGTIVYRFDSGAYGWQFNIMLDTEGKVSKVERLWIH